MKKCPYCGAPMEGTVCEYCGFEVEEKKEPTETKETQSANTIQNNIIFMNSQPQETQILVEAKSKKKALLLCIFLGYFGAHYFYLGKKKIGILYLFTMGLCGYGWIIDIFRILFGKIKDSRGLPLA